jgi:hypothetical protein
MKPAVGVTKRVSKFGGGDGCSVPRNDTDLGGVQGSAVGQCGAAIGTSKPQPRKAYLDGNLARRASGSCVCASADGCGWSRLGALVMLKQQAREAKRGGC